MNLYTREIMRVLGVDSRTALRVQNYIEEHDLIDWSEASSIQMRRAIKSAHLEMKQLVREMDGVS